MSAVCTLFHMCWNWNFPHLLADTKKTDLSLKKILADLTALCLKQHLINPNVKFSWHHTVKCAEKIANACLSIGSLPAETVGQGEVGGVTHRVTCTRWLVKVTQVCFYYICKCTWVKLWSQGSYRNENMVNWRHAYANSSLKHIEFRC